ncbi:hypothetical protein D3C76_429810 [compost metagenome]
MIKDDYQIECTSPANSIAIQLTLFKLGYYWESAFGQNVQNTKAKYLTFHYNGGRGLIKCSEVPQDFDTIEFKDGKFRVKHYPQLVVPARNKWRDEIILNETMDNHVWLNAYRANRDSNQFRMGREAERLCEYVLFLENKIDSLECLA